MKSLPHSRRQHHFPDLFDWVTAISEMVKLRRTQCEHKFSGLPLITDIAAWHLRNGGKTPGRLNRRHAVARCSVARCKGRILSSRVSRSL
jgi:hypothetical protein